MKIVEPFNNNFVNIGKTNSQNDPTGITSYTNSLD